MQLRMGNVVLREDLRNHPKTALLDEKKSMLVFDMVAPCGKDVQNFARIHEPGSDNPGLEMDKTYGVACIQRVLILLETWRHHVGLKQSNATKVVYEEVDD